MVAFFSFGLIVPLLIYFFKEDKPMAKKTTIENSLLFISAALAFATCAYNKSDAITEQLNKVVSDSKSLQELLKSPKTGPRDFVAYANMINGRKTGPQTGYLAGHANTIKAFDTTLQGLYEKNIRADVIKNDEGTYSVVTAVPLSEYGEQASRIEYGMNNICNSNVHGNFACQAQQSLNTLALKR